MGKQKNVTQRPNIRMKSSSKSKIKDLKIAKPQKKSRQKHKWSETRKIRMKKSQNVDVSSSKEGHLGLNLTPEKDEEIKVAKNMKRAKKLMSASEMGSCSKMDKVVGDKNKKESLRDKMMKRLEAARFRQVNEELDSTANNSDPVDAFQGDLQQFKRYHDAYRERVEHWPKNPLNVIIKWIKKKFKGEKVIADFGCGGAELAAAVPNKVHSFDFFALNDRVTPCDMSKVPLDDDSVDLAVFCLSLMGTDVSKFITEANRVLKVNGLLKIAEVTSRFSGNAYNSFLKRMKKFGFLAIQKGQGQQQQKKNDQSTPNQDNVFLMFEFKKVKTVKYSLGRLPAVKLNPSVYKKR